MNIKNNQLQRNRKQERNNDNVAKKMTETDKILRNVERKRQRNN